MRLILSYFVMFCAAMGYLFHHTLMGVFIGGLVLFIAANPERQTAKVFDTVAEDPIRWAFITFAVSMIGGGILYSILEGGSIIDGMWWVYVSGTTVGYGDFAPKTPEGRFIALFVIGQGVATVALLTAALSGRVAELRMTKRLAKSRVTQELDDDFDALIASTERLKEMYIAKHMNGGNTHAVTHDALSDDVRAESRRSVRWNPVQ